MARPYSPQRDIKSQMALAGIRMRELAGLTGYSVVYLGHVINGYALSKTATAKIRSALAEKLAALEPA